MIKYMSFSKNFSLFPLNFHFVYHSPYCPFTITGNCKQENCPRMYAIAWEFLSTLASYTFRLVYGCGGSFAGGCLRFEAAIKSINKTKPLFFAHQDTEIFSHHKAPMRTTIKTKPANPNK